MGFNSAFKALKRWSILDFKLSPCSVRCIFSSG